MATTKFASDCIPAPNSHFSFTLSIDIDYPNISFFFFVIGVQAMIILLTYSLLRNGPHWTRSIMSALPERVWSFITGPENDIDQYSSQFSINSAPTASLFIILSELCDAISDYKHRTLADPINIIFGNLLEFHNTLMDEEELNISDPAGIIADILADFHQGLANMIYPPVYPPPPRMSTISLPDVDPSPMFHYDSTLENSILAGSEPHWLEIQYDEDMLLETVDLPHLVTFAHFASGSLQESILFKPFSHSSLWRNSTSRGLLPTASATESSDADLSTPPSIRFNSPLPGLNFTTFTNDATTESASTWTADSPGIDVIGEYLDFMLSESSLSVTPNNDFGNIVYSTLPRLLGTSAMSTSNTTAEASTSAAELLPPAMDVAVENEPASSAELSSVTLETETGNEEHLILEGDFKFSTLRLSLAQWANLKTISLTKCELSGADLITILCKSTGLTKIEVDYLADATDFGVPDGIELKPTPLKSLKIRSMVEIAPLISFLNLQTLEDVTVSLPHHASNDILIYIPWESERFASFKIDTFSSRKGSE